jgi:hypothetical protein
METNQADKENKRDKTKSTIHRISRQENKNAEEQSG